MAAAQWIFIFSKTSLLFNSFQYTELVYLKKVKPKASTMRLICANTSQKVELRWEETD